MTTVAAKEGIMACDSMVTGAFPESSKKIRRRKDFIIGFSGDWVAGTHLMDNFLTGKEPTREKDDDVDFIILRKSGIYYMDCVFREVKIRGDYYAIGSGSQAAMVAMNMGADAKEAIQQAIQVDQYSGGRIQSLSL